MIGSLSTGITVKGTLTNGALIQGTLTNGNKVTGKMMTGMTINGVLDGKATITGSLSLPRSETPAPYQGAYEVTPLARESQTLATAHKVMTANVVVFEVPYYQTSNEHGDTVYIATGGN